MRRRYQQGSIRLEGKHNPVYVGRYLEDTVLENGQVKRIQRSVRLGTKQEFPTERLAKRELQRILEPINSLSYRPKHRITFTQAAEQWKRDIVRQYKPASRASVSSNLKRILEHFGPVECSALSTAKIQAWITKLCGAGLAPKTISNYVSTLQMMWSSLKSWDMVTGDPFENLVLPRAELKQQPSFTPEQAREIIGRAAEPYKTMFWLCAETGVRGGEICGLFADDVDTDARMLYVRRSAFQGQLQTPKTDNSVRSFPISAALADHIRAYTETVQVSLDGADTEQSVGGGSSTGRALAARQRTRVAPEIRPQVGEVAGSSPARHQLLFITPKTGKKGGCPYDNGNIVKRGLKPILRAMGIDGQRVGLHAFRHSSASAMDSMNAPMQVRQDRLGHGSARMTMRYTHSMSEDHRIVADALGLLFSPKPPESGGFVTSSAGDGSTGKPSTENTGQLIAADKSVEYLPADSHTETVQDLAMAGD